MTYTWNSSWLLAGHTRLASRTRLLALVAVLCTGIGTTAVWAESPATTPIKTPADPAAVLDQKIMAQAKTGSELIKNLTYLSDEIGPRLTGSAALKRANDWAAERMKAYGLSNVHLEPYEIPVGWERGTATAKIIEPDNGRSLIMASLGWTPGTAGKIQGDVVVLKARTKEDLAALKGKLKNAIILRGPPANVRPINDTSNPFDRPRNNGPRAAGNAARGAGAPGTPGAGGRRGGAQGFGQFRAFQREMAEFLGTEGAAVLLQDAGKPQGLLTTTGSWRDGDRARAPEPLPSLFVAHEHYALLYRLASRPAPARTRVEIEVTNKFVPGPITVYNTVGEIRGTEKPDEVVILGAHLDSWDLAQGTTDNGTGSTTVLETARVLMQSQVKPRRTIRFVLFTGEEEGLHGSKAYVKRHKDELAKVSLCLVHDTGTGKVLGIGLQGRKVLQPLFEKELASLKETGCTDFAPRSMGGSDHVSFESVGVPGFAVRQDMSEYRFTHHSQSDTLDKAHEPELIQGVQVMAVTAVRVANLPELLSREKPMAR